MAKKFTADQIQVSTKTDGIETAKENMSAQTKGEKRKYTRKSEHNRRLKSWEKREKVISVWLTETEYNNYIEVAEQSGERNKSDYLRKLINDDIRAFKGE